MGGATVVYRNKVFNKAKITLTKCGAHILYAVVIKTLAADFSNNTIALTLLVMSMLDYKCIVFLGTKNLTVLALCELLNLKKILYHLNCG